jgi:hypothetical protein
VHCRLFQTSFSHFLSSALHFGANLSLIGRTFKGRGRNVFGSEAADLELCEFSKVKADRLSGGAIFSVVPVRLFNCRFDSCGAQHGGAISSRDSLSMHCVSVLSCYATHSAAVDFVTELNADLDLGHCLFLNNRAIFFGLIYQSSVGACNITAVNMTHCRAGESVGCMESLTGQMRLRYSIVADSAAEWRNGGICTRALMSMAIEKCMFARCRHGADEPESAAALLFYDNPFASALTGCDFVQNDPNESCTVGVLGGHPLRVSACHFSGTEESEIKTGNVVVERCRFEEKTFAVVTPRAIGYNRSITWFPLEIGGSVQIDLSQLARVGVACLVGFAIAIILTVLHLRVCKGRVKVPRAIE